MNLRLLAILAVASAVTTAYAEGLDVDAAHALLNARVAAHRTSFDIYRDAGSAFNRGTLAEGAKVHADPSCIDDAASAGGCSSDLQRLDRTRGTVLRVTFDAVTAKEPAAASIEEPAQWSVHRTGRGYDVSGATAIVFDVRSPDANGIDVRFGAGERLTDFVHVPGGSAFTTITLPLQFLDEAALRDLHVLFTVATDGARAPNGGTLLIDNIRFLPAPASLANAIGFPLASESFGIVAASRPLSPRVTIPVDEATRNASTIYDSALTLLALLDRGTTDDVANARVIADAFHHALHHDNHGRPLVGSADGDSKQAAPTLRNGYRAGELPLVNDQSNGARANDARLATVVRDGEPCEASRSCVILDGATGGNVGYAILALTAAYQQFGDERYRTDAESLATWIVTELADSSAPGYGGYFLGYPDQEDPRRLDSTKSVADNAVIFAALWRLSSLGPLHIGAREFKWRAEARAAGDFVMRMFDERTGRFFAGTVPSGTPASFGVTPNGATLGSERINTFDSAEANVLAVLALAIPYRTTIDWSEPIAHVLGSLVTVTANSTSFTGTGFDAATAQGPAGISWETTAQAVIAARLTNCLFNAPVTDAIAQLRGQLALAQSSAPFTDGSGVVSSTLQNGELVPVAEQCLSTPSRCVPSRVGLAATAWSIFATRERNPFAASGTSSLCFTPKRRSVR
jgi:hypothetical protein